MEFDLQPKLAGELIEIRPLTVEDFDELFKAASDPLIWEQHPESDRYKREVFQRYFDGAIGSKGAFVVIERTSGRIIGSSRYWNLGMAAGEVEIGWTFLERAFWGGAFNRELKSLMIAHALRFVERVVFIVGVDNHRSQKAMEKIGAKFEGRADRPGPDGTMKLNVMYVVTRRPVIPVRP